MSTRSKPTHKVGDLINLRYEIVDVLGCGGMSSVYKVKDQNLNNQIVALKLLDPQLMKDMTNIERFKREAIIARRLDHPNIVRVFDFDVTELGEYFISMEYIEGITLDDRLKQSTDPLSIHRIAEILYHIASALEQAHQHGVVHRDLKPANVLLTNTGKTKITDFGLCRAKCFETTLSNKGECLGTPAYMSPEQIRGGTIDNRSDIYSFGILAYETCEGSPPFRGDAWYKIADMHLKKQIPNLSMQFPDWIRELVNKCAAKVPNDRYHSIREVIEVLEDHLDESKPQKSKKIDYSQYTFGAVGAACALIVCGVIGFLSAQHIAEATSVAASTPPKFTAHN